MVFRDERVALLHGQRLQPHRVARQALRKGDKLIAEDRDDENENNHNRQGESDENEKRCGKAVEPQPLKLEHNGVKKVSERNAGGERRYR